MVVVREKFHSHLTSVFSNTDLCRIPTSWSGRGPWKQEEWQRPTAVPERWEKDRGGQDQASGGIIELVKNTGVLDTSCRKNSIC